MGLHVNGGLQLPSFWLDIIFVVIQREEGKNLGVLLMGKFSCVISPSVVSGKFVVC
jgi:hypothetical protein